MCFFETGILHRWRKHVEESTKPDKRLQSRLLNHAIRKYGEEAFKVEPLIVCELHELNDHEIAYIAEYDSLAPNGYNLTSGGKQNMILAQEVRDRLSVSGIEYFKNDGVKEQKSANVSKYYYDKILDQYKDLAIKEIEIKPIKEGNDYKIVYLYIEEVSGIIHRTRIGGIHMSFIDSWNRAREMALTILNNDTTRLRIAHLSVSPSDEVLKYQSKADTFKDQKINKILVRRHTYDGSYIITLFIYTDKHNTYAKEKRLYLVEPQ